MSAPLTIESPFTSALQPQSANDGEVKAASAMAKLEIIEV
jgi:hypothetical protein